MRLFVALRPPAAALAHLEAQVAGLRDGASEWRWTPPQQWHLTLAFLGAVDERRYAELTPRLGRAAARALPGLAAGDPADQAPAATGRSLPGSPGRLALVGAGTFPRRPDRARVLWVGVHGDRAGLTRLAESVRAAARRCTIPVEDRAYSPHLTLARARPSVGADAAALVGPLSAYAGPAWTATELELVRSHLGPVVRHEILGSWPLGRRPAAPEDQDERAGPPPPTE